MNRPFRWLLAGVFVTGALASCSDEAGTPTQVMPQFSESGAAMVNLTVTGTSAVVNDAFLGAFGSIGSSGSGLYHSFVRISDANSIAEEGYNSSGRPVMPQVNTSPTFTKDLPLNRVPLTACGTWAPGEFCREFDADINQNAGLPSGLLDLLSVRLFLSPTAGLHEPGPDPNSDTFGQSDGTFLVWDLDGAGDVYARFDYNNNPGSGKGDVILLIKQDLFGDEANAACEYNGPEGVAGSGTTNCPYYVYLYSLWGTTDGTTGGDNNDGFEEWNTREAGFVTVEKTAETSFTREHTWEITKDVDPAVLNLLAGGSGVAGYTVGVTTTTNDYGYEVHGTITITNPSDEPVDINSVTDEVSGVEGSVTATCPVTLPYTLAGGATLECTYSKDLADDASRVNTATVLTGQGTYTGTAPVDFSTATITEEGFAEINVTDTNEEGGPWGPTGADATWTYDKTFTCSDNPADYTDGFYTYDVPNTATITETGQSADASVTVNCTLPYLEVSKTAAGTYDRTVTWTLEKSVDDDAHSGYAGEEAGSSTWTVVATKTEVSDNYQVAGQISIHNPAAVAQTFSVSDVLNDGTSATVTCPSNTVGAGATVVCSYTASPADNSANLNTATVSADGQPDRTATADLFWTENLIGYDGGTLADPRFGYEETIGSSTTENFPETFTCSEDAADYTDGSYSRTETNTATLDSNIGLEASATVTVDCTLPPLEVTKTAAGTYGRTVTWTLDKSVSPESHTGVAGQDAGISTWTVVATKNEVLSGYEVTGTISIHNPAAIAQSFSVGDELDDGTPVSVSCPSSTVAAGATVECSYTASPADASATLNTATVSATGNPDQVATAPVSFTEELTGDDQVTVDDDRNPAGFPTAISSSQTFNYDETFACSSNQADYTNGVDTDYYPNTATLTGDNTNLSDGAQVMVTCTLDALVPSKTASGYYDRAVAWTLEKSVAPESHSGVAGQDAGTSTWTVVATKSEELINYNVEGTVSIYNPAFIDQSFAVSDVLTDAGSATVASPAVSCDMYTIPAGGTASCTYDQSVDDDAAELNTATVSAVGNADQTATAPVSFSEENVIGGDDLVTVDDDRNPSGFPAVISASATFNYDETFACSSNQADYTNGVDTDVYPNTATLKGDHTDLSADAAVTVRCTLDALVATKTAAGTYDRTVTWTLEKIASPASHIGVPGDDFSSTWTVVATKTETFDNYAVAGQISIHNPALIPQTFSVGDALDDGTSPTPSCPSNTVGPGATVVCSYSAGTANDDATLNTATVSAAGNPDQVATAPVGWTENLIGYDGGTLADPRFGYSNEISGTTSVDFSETFTCPTSRDAYDETGTHSFSVINGATLDSNIGLDASATVTVECRASFVDIYKTTNGQPADPTKDIVFKLYDADDVELETQSTLVNGADIQFLTALVPGAQYTICENPVPAGYTFEISISVDGGNVLTYAGDPTGQIQCFDFTAPDPDTQVTIGFDIENSFPGGAPRTPGYWKNWSTCSGGNQVETAAKLGGVAEGVYLLDDLLPQTLGDWSVTNCPDAVNILDARDTDGDNHANDAAYTLARALLAARLNQDAGACTADGWTDPTYGTLEEVLDAADALLSGIGFDGTGDYLSPKQTNGKSPAAQAAKALAQDALYLAGVIDDYNNGEICTGEPSH